MRVIVGKYSGFCSGVKYTVSKALEITSSNNKVYCLGEIVHNERVIKDLEKNGLVTINDINNISDDGKLIIRAHGERIDIYDLCKKKSIEVFDLTCGKIKNIKSKVIKAKDNSYIIIIGKKNHPETIGVLSFCGDNASIVENEEDLFDTFKIIENSHLKRLYVLSQTTFSFIKFDSLVNIIRENYTGELIIDKTICDATEKRQNECFKLAKLVDCMIVIGGKNSSNTKELYNIALSVNKRSILIQEVSDLLQEKFNSDDLIGIMAGASTPEIVVNEVVEYLSK